MLTLISASQTRNILSLATCILKIRFLKTVEIFIETLKLLKFFGDISSKNVSLQAHKLIITTDNQLIITV